MRYNWRGASGRPPARHISALSDAERSALELPEMAPAHISDTRELIAGSTSDGNLEGTETAGSERSRARRLGAFLLCAAVLFACLLPFSQAKQTRGRREQHISIVRHGDKYSSYPSCSVSNGSALCYDQELMGNNPPLTPCGLQQAEQTADWLVEASRAAGGIQRIVSSPFIRCLETALPLAKRLGLSLNVRHPPYACELPGWPLRMTRSRFLGRS